jgi:hypothetical protein
MLYSSLSWYSCFLAQSDTQCYENEATDNVASQIVTGVGTYGQSRSHRGPGQY